jgi:hypothetical protein
MPMLEYMNRHLSPDVDKVYDASCMLVVNYLYSDIELFNGSCYDDPCRLDEWCLQDPDAPTRLHLAGLTHVVVMESQWPESRLSKCAVDRLLSRVWSSRDGLTLYRLQRE